MKRGFCWLLLLLLVITGCRKQEDPHPEWGEELVRIGTVMAAEAPEGFTLGESNDALAPVGIYYVTWTSGAGRAVTNADGKEATAYDAQLYVLLQECADADAAWRNVEEWVARERSTYEAGEESETTVNGQPFAWLPLRASQEENPYSHGAAAFGVRDRYALSVELLCGPDFSGDAEAVLNSFLQGIRY